jgi:hypothetical protein
MVDRSGFTSTEGVPELLRAIKAIEPRLVKQIGQRNKAIGQRIIDKAFPKPEAVGAGAGAKAKPSAAANVLRIIAGGKHRSQRVQQWGKRVVPREGVKRPYIRRSAEEDMPQIEKDYMDALLETARIVGIEARRG